MKKLVSVSVDTRLSLLFRRIKKSVFDKMVNRKKNWIYSENLLQRKPGQDPRHPSPSHMEMNIWRGNLSVFVVSKEILYSDLLEPRLTYATRQWIIYLFEWLTGRKKKRNQLGKFNAWQHTSSYRKCDITHDYKPRMGSSCICILTCHAQCNPSAAVISIWKYRHLPRRMSSVQTTIIHSGWNTQFIWRLAQNPRNDAYNIYAQNMSSNMSSELCIKIWMNQNISHRKSKHVSLEIFYILQY